MTPTRKTERSSAQAPTQEKRRRAYNSPKRQRQSARTRQRIIEAGAALVHEFTDWDWKQLTYRAVGERAGVSERTVFRYFATDTQLKDAVMHHLVKEADVDLQSLQVGDFADTVQKMFRYLSSFAIEPSATPDEPTFASMDSQRRAALLAAVERVTPAWSAQERETAAAALDIFWNMPPFERLVRVWGFDLERATRTVTWLVELIDSAIESDHRPG